MRVHLQILAPGMEHGEEPDRCSQMFGVARNGEQSFGGGAKKEGDRKRLRLFIESDGGDLLGHGEDYVKVFDRK